MGAESDACIAEKEKENGEISKAKLGRSVGYTAALYIEFLPVLNSTAGEDCQLPVPLTWLYGKLKVVATAVDAWFGRRGSIFCLDKHPRQTGFLNVVRKWYPTLLFRFTISQCVP